MLFFSLQFGYKLTLLWFLMFLKFHLKSLELSLFLGRREGPGKTTLSLFKDVTIRLGRAGVKGKSDDVTLYEGFFRSASSSLTRTCLFVGHTKSFKIVLYCYCFKMFQGHCQGVSANSFWCIRVYKGRYMCFRKVQLVQIG